jgi:hypothetical protein
MNRPKGMQVCLPGLLQTADYARDIYQQYHSRVKTGKHIRVINYHRADK